MAKIKGNSMLLYKDDVAIGCTTNSEFSSTNEEIDATCKDSDGAYDSLSGGNTAQFTADALYDTDATVGLSQLLAAHKDKTEIAVRMSVTGGGGLYIQAARAVISQLTVTSPLNAPVTYSATINVRGTWNYGTHT
jgi:hypothetical protein